MVEIIEAAVFLGARGYIEHGRAKVEGNIASIKRTFAICGYDIIADGEGSETKSWVCRRGSEMATIVAMKATKYAYGYTAKVA